jgi:hypothetical protein
MGDLGNGTLVKHNSLGVGKIIAVEPNAIHVFFPDSDKRFAAKLRLPAARPLLRTEGLEPNRWLDGLSAFELDPVSGRYGLTATWLTHDQAIAQYLALHPEGFGDKPGATAAKPDRAMRWRAAHAAWMAKLGDGQGEKLLAAGDLNLLVKRALDVEKIVAPLHPPSDADSVKAAFADPEATAPFFTALFELLSATTAGKAKFEALFKASRALPVESAHQWMVATLYPFIAAPEKHVLLRPRSTAHAAERLGCDLGGDGSPAWYPYATLRGLSVQLLEQLAPKGAKDFVDVEGFLHVTGAARRPSTKAGGLATPRTPRAGARTAGAKAGARSNA